MTDTSFSGTEQWVVWNGSLGVLDMVTIGRVEADAAGRQAQGLAVRAVVLPVKHGHERAAGLLRGAAQLDLILLPALPGHDEAGAEGDAARLLQFV